MGWHWGTKEKEAVSEQESTEEESSTHMEGHGRLTLIEELILPEILEPYSPGEKGLREKAVST